MVTITEKPSPRKNRTICISFSQEIYHVIINDSLQFRNYLDNLARLHPELFPDNFHDGYRMKEIRNSKKLKIIIRRISISGISYTVRPSFVMPYMTGMVQDVEIPLFLRKFSVPFWALSRCYGKNSQYWYRLEASLGRNSLVGTTIKSSEKLPDHVSADEKHTRLSGQKTYVATTVGGNCILGACVSIAADQENLQRAYGVFKSEAQNIKPDYSPKTVNTDGWFATINSWKNLFPFITVIACFLHIFISIRDRSKKKYKEIFLQVSDRLWECYRAETKVAFSQRVRRLYEWCCKKEVPSVISDKINKLRNNITSFTDAYRFTNAHRTSNMVDRLLQRMDRHLFSTQFFHGNETTSSQNIRAWALIQNFAPWNPYTVKKYNGINSPAEKLNGFQYHDNWLENLLISASLGGYRDPPPKTG